MVKNAFDLGLPKLVVDALLYSHDRLVRPSQHFEKPDRESDFHIRNAIRVLQYMEVDPTVLEVRTLLDNLGSSSVKASAKETSLTDAIYDKYLPWLRKFLCSPSRRESVRRRLALCQLNKTDKEVEAEHDDTEERAQVGGEWAFPSDFQTNLAAFNQARGPTSLVVKEKPASSSLVATVVTRSYQQRVDAGPGDEATLTGPFGNAGKRSSPNNPSGAPAAKKPSPEPKATAEKALLASKAAPKTALPLSKTAAKKPRPASQVASNTASSRSKKTTRHTRRSRHSRKKKLPATLEEEESPQESSDAPSHDGADDICLDDPPSPIPSVDETPTYPPHDLPESVSGDARDARELCLDLFLAQSFFPGEEHASEETSDSRRTRRALTVAAKTVLDRVAGVVDDQFDSLVDFVVEPDVFPPKASILVPVRLTFLGTRSEQRNTRTIIKRVLRAIRLACEKHASFIVLWCVDVRRDGEAVWREFETQLRNEPFQTSPRLCVSPLIAHFEFLVSCSGPAQDVFEKLARRSYFFASDIPKPILGESCAAMPHTPPPFHRASPLVLQSLNMGHPYYGGAVLGFMIRELTSVLNFDPDSAGTVPEPDMCTRIVVSRDNWHCNVGDQGRALPGMIFQCVVDAATEILNHNSAFCILVRTADELQTLGEECPGRVETCVRTLLDADHLIYVEQGARQSADPSVDRIWQLQVVPSLLQCVMFLRTPSPAYLCPGDIFADSSLLSRIATTESRGKAFSHLLVSSMQPFGVRGSHRRDLIHEACVEMELRWTLAECRAKGMPIASLTVVAPATSNDLALKIVVHDRQSICPSDFVDVTMAACRGLCTSLTREDPRLKPELQACVHLNCQCVAYREDGQAIASEMCHTHLRAIVPPLSMFGIGCRRNHVSRDVGRGEDDSDDTDEDNSFGGGLSHKTAPLLLVAPALLGGGHAVELFGLDGQSGLIPYRIFGCNPSRLVLDSLTTDANYAITGTVSFEGPGLFGCTRTKAFNFGSAFDDRDEDDEDEDEDEGEEEDEGEDKDEEDLSEGDEDDDAEADEDDAEVDEDDAAEVDEDQDDDA